jgi:hypothetical protein
MESISRRRFLRDASIGAAAVGAAAAVGRQGLAAAVSKQPATAATSLGAGTAVAAGTATKGLARPRAARGEVMAHVIGGPSGTVEIYSGTTLVTLHNPTVASALLSALG